VCEEVRDTFHHALARSPDEGNANIRQRDSGHWVVSATGAGSGHKTGYTKPQSRPGTKV
jgi:hypothetical protein